MSNRFLIRPEVHKKTSKNKSDFLPADLAAAYACYHDNLVEQRKLEQKLQVIDIETRQMKRDFRQQREVLERELKENEREYWNCHRVFSAATLITESDSYRKRFYTGPQPTKAKLPRRTLERLSHLVRKLQAEDDLETLLRFQRCARFARRRVDSPKSASSLTLTGDDNSDMDSFELQRRVTELKKERSIESAGSFHTSTSGRIQRIRSAPSRVAPRKKELTACSDEGHSAFLQRYSPDTRDETSRHEPTKNKESDSIALNTGVRERTSTRIAWAEEVFDAVRDAVDGSLDVSCIVPSYDSDLPLNKKSQSSTEHEQSRDEEKLAAPLTEHHTSQDSDMELFSHLSLRQHLRKEPFFEHTESNETVYTREEGATDSEIPASDVLIISCTAGQEMRGNEVVVRLQPEGITDGSRPRKGSAFRNVVHVIMNKQRETSSSSSAMSDLGNALESENVTNVSKKRAHESDSLQSESNEKFSVDSQRGDNTILDPVTWDKQTERTADQVTVNMKGTNDRRGTADHKAQRRRSSTLPKSSLHGLSSRRKSLTPRTHHKSSQQQNQALKKAKVVQGTGKQSLDSVAIKSHPHKDLPDNDTKRQEEGRQPNAPRKRRVSIFKRKCLSDVLFSGQAQVESQLRNRVQGFLGTIEDVPGETGEEE